MPPGRRLCPGAVVSQASEARKIKKLVVEAVEGLMEALKKRGDHFQLTVLLPIHFVRR